MNTVMVDIKKKGKGHDVFINGAWHFWVIGSKKNAKTELQTVLRSMSAKAN